MIPLAPLARRPGFGNSCWWRARLRARFITFVTFEIGGIAGLAGLDMVREVDEGECLRAALHPGQVPSDVLGWALSRAHLHCAIGCHPGHDLPRLPSTTAGGFVSGNAIRRQRIPGTNQVVAQGTSLIDLMVSCLLVVLSSLNNTHCGGRKWEKETAKKEPATGAAQTAESNKMVVYYPFEGVKSTEEIAALDLDIKKIMNVTDSKTEYKAGKTNAQLHVWVTYPAIMHESDKVFSTVLLKQLLLILLIIFIDNH